MKVTNLEKETVFLYNEAERTATVDTYNPKLLNQLAKAAQMYPEDCKLKWESPTGNKGYEVPKSWVKLKLPMKLTAEQRAERAARLSQRSTQKTENGERNQKTKECGHLDHKKSA